MQILYIFKTGLLLTKSGTQNNSLLIDLYFVCLVEKVDFVELALFFIENHAEIYIKNNDGKTVLHVTVNPSTKKIMKKAHKKR